MNIKNLKIFNNSNAKVRLCALALAGAMTITILSGCSSEDNSENSTQYEELIKEDTKKIFEIGEHIISIPTGNPTLEIKQYDYYEGYKCVGFGTSSYGKFSNNFGGACILYVNEYPVECYASDKDENNLLVYNDFGTPLNFEKLENNTTEDTKDFGVGEHIISVPIGDPRDLNKQYDYYEGYEPIDIAIAAYGKFYNNYSGGAIMYVNIVPVRCKVTSYDVNNKAYYSSFGTPIEPEKTLTK